MKLKLHKYILKLIVGLFVISPSFVYAEGFKISLYPSKAEQVISCISFFAHKISISDLTEEEYRKLVALANFELNMKTLPPLPNRSGRSQEEAKEELRKRTLEMVRFGISYDVYQEVLNYVKTSEEINEFPNPIQINREIIIQEQRSEALSLLEEEKKHAREVLIRYPYIIVDPNNLNPRYAGDGKTYLHLAVYEKDTELVEALLLLNPTLLDTRDKNGETALLNAVRNSRDDTVEILLVKGADPNLQNKDGETALMEAAFKGRNDIVIKLLEKSADPNLQDKGGETALIRAAANGHNDVVTTLLEKGADPNLQARIAGGTARFWATYKGHIKIAELLRAHGAKYK